MTATSTVEPADEPSALPRRALQDRLQAGLQEYGIVVALASLIVLLSVLSPVFLTPRNVLNVLDQIAVAGIVAVGMTLLMITGAFDLSVGSMVGLSAAITLGLTPSIGLLPAVAAGVASAALVGLVNGLVVTKAGINSLIVTLGTLSAVRGLVLLYTDGRSIPGSGGALLEFANGRVLLPNSFWVLAVVAVAVSLLLVGTVAGRHFYAVGGNARASELAGIPVDRYRVVAFVVTGLLAGVAGVIYGGRLNSVDPNAGAGLELDVIAAVIIGGTSLFGGAGAVWKTIVGVLLLAVLTNGFNLLNVNTYFQYVVKGLVIVLSVLIYTRRAGR